MLNSLVTFVQGLLEPFLILSSYISNTNSFPKPLSKEEEAELLKKVCRGQ